MYNIGQLIKVRCVKNMNFGLLGEIVNKEYIKENNVYQYTIKLYDVYTTKIKALSNEIEPF